MQDLAKDIQKTIIDSLQKTLPVALAKESKLSSFIDRSTKNMGYSKILKSGYTP